MIKLECEATVTYTCYLTNEDENKVINYFYALYIVVKSE